MLSLGPVKTCLITTCADATLLAKQRVADTDIALLELEDGVAPRAKEQARQRAVQALKTWDYGHRERWVRINHVDSADGFRDLMVIAEGRPDVVVPPKVRSAREIAVVDYMLARREEELGFPPGIIKIAPMIESGPAVLNLQGLLEASPRITGIHLGVEDLSVDVGIVRTESSYELEYIKSKVVLICHSLGVYAYDVASANIDDTDALYAEARRAYHLGFDGKASISPRQNPTIRRAFSPSEAEIVRAKRVVTSSREAAESGLSVYSVDGKMVDAPFVDQALDVLQRAGIDVDSLEMALRD